VRVIGRLLRFPQYRGKREGSSPSVVPLSELDFFGGRLGIGHGIILCDRFQDLQDAVAVAALAEQGHGKVAGHLRIRVKVAEQFKVVLRTDRFRSRKRRR